VKKIAVFTGTRAEYGLLYWLMKEIEQDQELELQVIVSGMHLSHEFGYTVDSIEDDGFRIHERVEMLLSSSSGVGIAKSLGLGVIGFADALYRLQPDCLVILGDRFEALSIAQTAMVLQIPIVHLHGGELTEGVIDEAIRHSITKMAHLHFTSAEVYRNRVIQLGESPETVFNVGAPAIENVNRLELLSQKELEDSLGFELGNRPLLVTYHPVTLKEGGGIDALRNLLEALGTLDPAQKIVITSPNADTNGRELIALLQSFSATNRKQVLFTQSLGQLRYLSLMKICGAVIGNSSSGLIEAPLLGVPTIDIGIRQKGRFKPGSVIESGDKLEEIKDALAMALSPNHLRTCEAGTKQLGEGNLSQKIVRILKDSDLPSLIMKKFYDLGSQ